MTLPNHHQPATVEATLDAPTQTSAPRLRLLTRPSTAPLLRTLRASRSSVIGDCAFSPDGAQMIATNASRELRRWEVASGAALTPWTLEDSYEAQKRIAWSPDGAWVASLGGVSGVINLWETATGQRRRTLPAVGGAQTLALAFSPDGALLVTSDANGVVRLWETASGAELVSVVACGPETSATAASASTL